MRARLHGIEHAAAAARRCSLLQWHVVVCSTWCLAHVSLARLGGVGGGGGLGAHPAQAQSQLSAPSPAGMVALPRPAVAKPLSANTLDCHTPHPPPSPPPPLPPLRPAHCGCPGHNGLPRGQSRRQKKKKKKMPQRVAVELSAPPQQQRRRRRRRRCRCPPSPLCYLPRSTVTRLPFFAALPSVIRVPHVFRLAASWQAAAAAAARRAAKNANTPKKAVSVRVT